MHGACPALPLPPHVQDDVARLQAALQEAQAAGQAAVATQGSTAGEMAAQLDAARRECARLQQEVERLQHQHQQAEAAASGTDGLATELQQR